MKTLVEAAYENPTLIDQDGEHRQAVLNAIEALDSGQERIAVKGADSQWTVNSWLKKAVLLYFRIQKMEVMESGPFQFHDKIPLKTTQSLNGVRVVPGAIARKASFIEPGAILMPSFVNIGAYVGSGTMVDTWATVGSCAQIGKNVHLSGGVGIGGVLEPPQAGPVIVEDNVFLGSRCIVVEGAHIGEGAVLGANVTITKSTKIIDVTGSEEKVYQGVVPPRSVVIPGTRIKEFPAGSYGISAAIIIGQRKASTDEKTSLNDTLREFNVSV